MFQPKQDLPSRRFVAVPQVVVDGFDLRVARGEFISVIG